ncbi:L-cysteine desulfidase family protein [Oribacterium sp. WCC10]|uniref:L-cysteine desulfidase family protein n=1 Tax=Oribacterium sp. WCC10 TaxID=1855343 RepID=UPI0008DF43E7|nr:L-serine ammonia-lyase, iron-sulfur-dependent, subunit alpha [Oribacterium sp. WCC10]SFG63665.1 L-cysteine desulfidase [Oribacterium sp. WCC10]
MAEFSLDKELMDNYTDILRNELIPAMGCTEPIAIAYAAAMARKVLSDEPVHITINCSGNMIKNVKGVKVPNSGGQRGIEVAATLGVVGGNPDKKLEVIAEVTDEDRDKTRELVAQKFCDCNYVENVPNLYIQALIKGKEHDAEVVIAEHHTDITLIKRDGEVLVEHGKKNEYSEAIHAGNRNLMSLKGLLDYANQVDLSEVEDILNRQIKMNSAISQEGLDNPWGASVGKTILENFGHNVKSCACACAAAGSDARMSGCPMPVVINSGSGNQGITVTMPVVVYARELSLSDEKRMRALIISNLVSIYIKHYIGALSAFCGAVSASCGAGAAITYMSGGDYVHIAKTITNTLANVGGIVCDGAKPSCAAKIAASVHAALLAHYMSMNDKSFQPGEGIVEEDVEQTIKNMGYIGKIGMMPTDKEILNVMTDKVDVGACL